MWTVLTVIFILIIGVYVYFTIQGVNQANKNKFNVPFFSGKKINEMLDQRGPANITDALQIFEGNYNFRSNNVIKAASILGDAYGHDESKAVDYLIQNLYSDNPKLVMVSAISLGKLKVPKALPVLEKLKNAQPKTGEVERERSLRFEKEQREAYAKRIGATLINYPEIPSASDLYTNVRDSAVWALNEISGEIERIKLSNSLGVADSFKVLNNQGIFDTQKFYTAILGISEAEKNEIPQAINQLISYLNHPDPNVVSLSVVGLGKIGDAKSLSALKELSEKSWENNLLKMCLDDSIEKISSRVKS